MDPLYPIQQPSDIPPSSGIYKIRCLSNGKVYIGSSVNLQRRWREHRNALRRNGHSNQLLQNAWNKYPEQEFVFEIIELVLPAFLLEREQYWLDKIRPFSPNDGMNIARSAQSVRLGAEVSLETREKQRKAKLGKPGPWAGKHRPPETREKLRLAQLARFDRSAKPTQKLRKIRIDNIGWKHTEEARRKMRGPRKGSKRPPHSSETRRKISEALTGKTVSPETRERLRVAHLGHVPTDEARAKTSLANRGRRYEPEAYASRRKSLIVISPDGVEQIIHDVPSFCKEHGLLSSGVWRTAQGKQSNTQGWKARYLDPDIS